MSVPCLMWRVWCASGPSMTESTFRSKNDCDGQAAATAVEEVRDAGSFERAVQRMGRRAVDEVLRDRSVPRGQTVIIDCADRCCGYGARVRWELMVGAHTQERL